MKGRGSRLATCLLPVMLIGLAACGDEEPSDDGGGGGGGFGGGTSSAAVPGSVPKACEILESQAVGELGESAIDSLVQAVTRGRHEGGFAATLLVGFIQSSCDYLLPHAIAVAQDLFGEIPDESRIAPISTYERLDVELVLLAAQLGMTSAGVQDLVERLCHDVQGGAEDPIAALRDVLPDVDLSDLTAVNGLVAKVTQDCKGLESSQADELTSNSLLYLISNGSTDPDVTPPLVISFNWTRLDPTSIRLSWNVLEAGDSATFDVWVWAGEDWRPFHEGHSGTTIDVFDVFSDRNYWFALRASDADGNVSAWRYLNPCLRCG